MQSVRKIYLDPLGELTSQYKISDLFKILIKHLEKEGDLPML